VKTEKTQEEFFIEYLEKVKKLISKLARVYCNDIEDRKDLIQDITLQLWKAFPKYDGKHALSTWTYRIVINVAISSLRKASSRKKTLESYKNEHTILELDESVEDEKLEQLYRFIDLLKPLDKAIIILYMEGCSNKEIAQVMGLSNSNVSTKKLRIKEQLKSYFEFHKI